MSAPSKKSEFPDVETNTEATSVNTEIKTPLIINDAKIYVGLLQVVEGAEKGSIIPLESRSPITIGRSSECNIIFDNPNCSRVHAQIVQGKSTEFVVEDLKSTNGTLVNNVRISSPTMLKTGDKLTFGKNLVVLFKIVDSTDADLQLYMYNRANVDQLTGSANRYRFNETLEKELAMLRRSQSSLGLIYFDVDHFKKINDTWGHPVGDAVLREIGQRIRSTIRKEDLFARIGGEEFAIIARNQKETEVRTFSDRILLLMSTTPLKHENKSIPFTVSVGCVYLNVGTQMSSSQLVELTDKALYFSKQNGRNRVTFQSL